MGREMAWDEARIEHEARRYEEFARREHSSHRSVRPIIFRNPFQGLRARRGPQFRVHICRDGGRSWIRTYSRRPTPGSRRRCTRSSSGTPRRSDRSGGGCSRAGSSARSLQQRGRREGGRPGGDRPQTRSRQRANRRPHQTSARPPRPPVPSRSRGPPAKLVANMTESLTVPTATTFRVVPVATLEERRRRLNQGLQAAGRVGQGLVHPPHRLRARAGHQAASGHGTHPPDAGGHSPPGPAGRHRPGARGGRAAEGRQPRSGGAGDQARGDDGLRRLPRRLRGPGREGAHQQAACPTTSPAPRCRSPTPAASAPSPRCRGSWPARAASSRSARSATRPSSPPFAEERLREFGISKVMTVTSTYDHRVIQGAESGAFLATLDHLLQGDQGFYELVEESLQLSAVSYQLVSPPRPPSGTRRLARSRREMLYHVAAAMALVKAFRMHGHLAAQLDPLGTPPIGDPALDPGPLGLTPEVMAAIPSKVLRIAVPGRTLAESLPHLQATYCGTMAYEIEHIATHEERVWLREKIESGRLPAADGAGRAAAPAAPPHRGRGARAVPAQGLPRPEALLDRRCGHAGADAGSHHRARRRGGRAGRGDRHGASRPAQRAGPHGGPPLRDHLRRVRGRPAGGGRAAHAGGRHRRREVPPRRRRRLRHLAGQGHHREPVAQSESPRVRRARGGRTRAGEADPAARTRSAPRSFRRAARGHSWRRGVRGPGCRGRDAQPRRPRGVPDRRHAPPHHQQPGRLHHRHGGRALHPLRLAISPRASTSRSSMSMPTTRRRASAPRGSRWRTGTASTRTC